jgi:hypothetical protein
VAVDELHGEGGFAWRRRGESGLAKG